MRERNLQGASRRKAFKTTTRDKDARPAPDRLWIADIPDVPSFAAHLFLAVVLDVFSRRFVGWAMAPHMRANWSATRSIWPSTGASHRVSHHSDQGSQPAFNRSLQHPEVKELLWERQSMVDVGEESATILAEPDASGPVAIGKAVANAVRSLEMAQESAAIASKQN